MTMSHVKEHCSLGEVFVEREYLPPRLGLTRVPSAAFTTRCTLDLRRILDASHNVISLET